MARSYAPEVIADNSGKWVGNGLRFATEKEAAGYVEHLMMRWTSVRDMRVVESLDPVNRQWKDGAAYAIELVPDNKALDNL